MRTVILIFGLVVIFTTTSCTSTIAVRPANTTIVKVAPKHYKIVVVKGNRYYYWNGKHYKKTNKGYVFVAVR